MIHCKSIITKNKINMVGCISLHSKQQYSNYLEDYGTCTCIYIFPLINSYIKSRFNKALDTDSLDNIGKI